MLHFSLDGKLYFCFTGLLNSEIQAIWKAHSLQSYPCVVIQRRDREVCTPDSYSGGPGFETWPGYNLS
jgi:hypothetical protein